MITSPYFALAEETAITMSVLVSKEEHDTRILAELSLGSLGIKLVYAQKIVVGILRRRTMA